jgi:hypothetical protein
MAPRVLEATATAAALLVIVACGADAEPPVDGRPPIMVCASARTVRSARPSQCGPTADFTPINRYQGSIGSVQEREDAVVLINGNCTGTLIAAAAGPVVLTAGHCVGLGDEALVAFNVEAERDGDPAVTGGTVIEQSSEPDYALIELAALPDAAAVALTTRPTDRLAIIQHPRGRPKEIAEGDFADSCNGQLYYTELDTLVSSSGAGVLNQQGFLVGVHTDGDCDAQGGGANFGWTAARIVEVSAYLQDADIADR